MYKSTKHRNSQRIEQQSSLASFSVFRLTNGKVSPCSAKPQIIPRGKAENGGRRVDLSDRQQVISGVYKVIKYTISQRREQGPSLGCHTAAKLPGALQNYKQAISQRREQRPSRTSFFALQTARRLCEQGVGPEETGHALTVNIDHPGLMTANTDPANAGTSRTLRERRGGSREDCFGCAEGRA